MKTLEEIQRKREIVQGNGNCSNGPKIVPKKMAMLIQKKLRMIRKSKEVYTRINNLKSGLKKVSSDLQKLSEAPRHVLKDGCPGLCSRKRKAEYSEHGTCSKLPSSEVVPNAVDKSVSLDEYSLDKEKQVVKSLDPFLLSRTMPLQHPDMLPSHSPEDRQCNNSTSLHELCRTLECCKLTSINCSATASNNLKKDDSLLSMELNKPIPVKDGVCNILSTTADKVWTDLDDGKEAKGADNESDHLLNEADMDFDNYEDCADGDAVMLEVYQYLAS